MITGRLRLVDSSDGVWPVFPMVSELSRWCVGRSLGRVCAGSVVGGASIREVSAAQCRALFSASFADFMLALAEIEANNLRMICGE